MQENKINITERGEGRGGDKIDSQSKIITARQTAVENYYPSIFLRKEGGGLK